MRTARFFWLGGGVRCHFLSDPMFLPGGGGYLVPGVVYGTIPFPVNRQTRVKTLPSRNFTGGKNVGNRMEMEWTVLDHLHDKRVPWYSHVGDSRTTTFEVATRFE